ITVAHLTPAMAQLLTELPAGDAASAPPTVPSRRYTLLVGDVLTRLDADRIRRIAPNVTVVNLYGSTETQRAVGFHVVLERELQITLRGKEVLPLGRGMEDVQLLVLRASTPGTPPALAGIGEVGEIAIRSPHLAAGYLGDESLTALRFLANPFVAAAERSRSDRLYRTGDLGRYLPDGQVAFAGRADLQVKIRGFRIEPGEIEAALRRLPGVLEAVVLALATDAGEKRLVAFVVPERPDEAPAVADLRDALRRAVPAYMVPAAFVTLDRLPLTPNAKIDRRALARSAPQAGADGAEAGAHVAPASALELQIAEVWRLVLGRERVSVQQNFFDLGGHSLLLVRLHARLEEKLERPLSLVELFNYPTVRAFAEHLARRDGAPQAIDETKSRAQRQIEAARRQKEMAQARRRS
ncbi:MAG TPA: phosphopantetheine-binding protein, partial [Thermoanaerobaculia bacterium]